MRFIPLLSIWLILCSCSSNVPLPVYDIAITEQNSGSSASLRGLSVIDSLTAWVSGSKGTVLRTINGGNSWQNVSSSLPDTLDFRDIEAFSEEKAIIITAGYPGQIYKTTDGGKRWHLVHEDLRQSIFYDAMGFWDDNSGIAFGDAIHNRVVLVTTSNSGLTWQNISGDESPKAVEDEGGFAASGTCLTTFGEAEVWIALGTPNSRIIYSPNRGKSWNSYETPMAQTAGSAGIFSLAFASSSYGIAVGGDYQIPEDSNKVISITKNGGRSWELLQDSGIGGFKSAIAYVPESGNWLSTGTDGSYYSFNMGNNWTKVDTIGYHAVQLVDNRTGWLSGGNGKIAKVKLTRQYP